MHERLRVRKLTWTRVRKLTRTRVRKLMWVRLLVLTWARTLVSAHVHCCLCGVIVVLQLRFDLRVCYMFNMRAAT